MIEDNPYQTPESYTEESTPPLEGTLPDQSRALKGYGMLQMSLGALHVLALAGTIFYLLKVVPTFDPDSIRTFWQLKASQLLEWTLWAVTLICLGIGSFKARRWAWPLSLIVAGISLFWAMLHFLGQVVLLFLTLTDHAAFADQTPWFLGLLWRLLCVIGVGLPLLLIRFYRRPAVRETCEWYDRQVRWTDRRPLPIVAMTVLLAYDALTMHRWMLMCYGLKVFGVEVSGPPAVALVLALTLALAALTWGVYHQERTALWGAAAIFLIAIISNAANLTHIDLKAGGSLWDSGSMRTITALSFWTVQLIYLASVRHYFLETDSTA